MIKTTKIWGFLITFVLIVSSAGTGAAAPPFQAPPIPIRYGETVEETINDEQSVVTYIFDGTQTDQIVATAISVNGDLDPFLTLSTFVDGTVLASDDNSAGDNNALISYTLPADGAYVLTMTRSSEAPGNTSGLFQLTLITGAPPPTVAPTDDGSTIGNDDLGATDFPPAVATSVPEITINASDQRLQRVLVGSTVRGSLTGNVNFNLYWLTGRADQEIILTPEPSSAFQPLMVVYNSDFTEIFRGQPGQTINVTLSSDAIYFLAVATLQQGSGGQYTFTLTERLSAETATTEDRDILVYGDSVNGAISNSNPTIRYRFRGGSGDLVTISMTSVSGDLDSFLLLVDASGTTIAQDDNSGSGGTNAQIVATLPNDGDYFVIATRRGQEQGITSGNFLLALASDAPPRLIPTVAPQIPAEYADFDQIRYGDTVQGDISNAIYFNSVIFYGDAGDRIVIEMTAVDNSLDPMLILLDDQLIPLAENDDIADGNRDSRLEFQLPRDGYYAIVATRFEQEAGTSAGSYELTLSRSENVVTNESVIDQLAPTRFTVGENPSGSFEPLKFASIYSFSAAQGTQIGFSVNPEGSTTLATVILVDSRMNYITSSDNGILLAITAPVSDDYLVFVAPQAGPAANISDTFFVVLETDTDTSPQVVIEGDGIPITYGSTVRGRISDDQPEIRYVFQGQAGDIAEIGMTAEQASEPLDTLLRLEDADGNILAENDDIEPGVIRNSFLSFRLPTDGQYTIVATRFSGDPEALTVGGYNLSLQYQDPTLEGTNRSATPISYGETLTDTIDDDTYLFFYYFEGRQFDNIIIEVTAQEGNLDGILYLYAQDSTGEFRLLETNDDSPLGGTYDPYIAYTLPRTGGYVIAVTRFDEVAAEPTSGTFSISLRLDASGDE